MTKRPSGSGDDCGVPDFMETLAGSIRLCVLATSPGFWSLMQPFLLDSMSWENVKELCVTSKGLQQTEEAKLMEVTAGADTECGSLWEEKGSLWTKDHRGKWRNSSLL